MKTKTVTAIAAGCSRWLIAAPPTSTGKRSPRRYSSCTHSGICLDVLTSSADKSDRVGADFYRLLDDRVDRHLLAQVVHGVAVVAEDRVDQVLADVVHVAIHRRQHDLALGRAIQLVEVALQVRDRPLHHLGDFAAQTAGSARRRRICRRPLSSPAAAPVEHINRLEAARRVTPRHRAGQRRHPQSRARACAAARPARPRYRFRCLPSAVNDLPVNPLVDRHTLGRVGALFASRRRRCCS